jgi:hypothetical protein
VGRARIEVPIVGMDPHLHDVIRQVFETAVNLRHALHILPLPVRLQAKLIPHFPLLEK